MLKSIKSIVIKYANDHSLNDKEIVDLLCEYMEYMEKQHTCQVPFLEEFLENRITSK